jgi:spoIIIJ-associated protein
VTAEGPGAAAVARTLDAVVEGMGLTAQVVVAAGPDENDIEASVAG